MGLGWTGTAGEAQAPCPQGFLSRSLCMGAMGFKWGKEGSIYVGPSPGWAVLAEYAMQRSQVALFLLP